MSTLSKESIEQMNEKDFRNQVLIPLLKAMGYQAVFEWHGGPGELGKDIVCWYIDPLSRTRRNLAIVAKAKHPSGNPALKDIASQVAQALNHPFREPSTQEELYVNDVWIMVNKRLSKETRGRIDATLAPEHLRNREIKDIDQIWDYVQDHLIKTTIQLLDETAEQLKQLNAKYRVDVSIDESGNRRLTISERYPGQSQEEPLEGRVQFEFPNTPEARAQWEELQQSLESGEEVVIPAEYVKDIGVPEEFRRIVEALFGAFQPSGMSLHITPVLDKRPRLLSLELAADDGDYASLPYIDMHVLQAGTHRITLDNRNQPIPILVTMVLDFKDMAFNMNITLKDGAIPVHWLSTALSLVSCLHKPGHINVTSLDVGLPLSNKQHPGISDGYTADPAYRALITDLVAIQSKVNQPIAIPRRDFTADERETIDLARHVLHHGEVTGTWTDIAATWLWTKQEMETSLAYFDNGTAVRVLRSEEEQSCELFGSTFSLGKVRTVFTEARLVNAQEIRDRFAHVNPDEQIEVEVRFEPGHDNTLVSTYLDWVSPQEG